MDHNGTALGHIIGLYSFLLQVIATVIAAGRFSYDQMLDPKGNTAVYVLYAYARIAGVLRRAEHDVSSLSASDLSLTEPSVFWLQGVAALCCTHQGVSMVLFTDRLAGGFRPFSPICGMVG